MGREIRRVPKDWEHPRNSRGDYQPLVDEDYESAITNWIENGRRFIAGEDVEYGPTREDYPRDWRGYAEWFGAPPDPEYYRPAWVEASHYQVYETVSEGTPVSPVLESTEAVIDWLVDHGAGGIVGPVDRIAAEAFVRTGYAPSFVTTNDGLINGIEAMGDL